MGKPEIRFVGYPEAYVFDQPESKDRKKIQHCLWGDWVKLLGEQITVGTGKKEKMPGKGAHSRRRWLDGGGKSAEKSHHGVGFHRCGAGRRMPVGHAG
ncbi:MAG TPA: hypothetical protein PK961_11340 [bacterium]|nr:hypothetical protein [bacterium]